MFKIEVAKIVGASNQAGWCQVHTFTPQEEKKQKWGSLVAVFAFKAKSENLEIASYGAEIIQRFHEIYFADPAEFAGSQKTPDSNLIGGKRQYSSEDNVLANLENSLKKIQAEFETQVELQVAVGVIIDGENPVLYAASQKAQVKIWRQGHLFTLLGPEKQKKILESENPDSGLPEKIKTISGWLQAKDIIILGSNQFFNQLAEGFLTASLQKQNLETTKEDLATFVGAREDNSQTASAVIMCQEEKTTQPQTAISPQTKSKVWEKIKSFTKQVSLPNTEKVNIFLKNRVQAGHGKKVNLAAALILFFLLLASIVIGVQKRSWQNKNQQEKKILEQLSSGYQQASQLSISNPTKAREVLIQSQNVLDSYLQQVKNESKSNELATMQEKIKAALENLTKEYPTQKAEVFYEFNLLKQGFFGQIMTLNEQQIFVLDQNQTVVLELNISTKQGKIVAGGEKLKGANKLGVIPGFVFVATPDKLFLVKEESGKIIDEKEIKDLGPIQDMIGFGPGAYLLGKNQIHKFIALDNQLSDKRDYLTKPDEQLNQAISISIDGSVWILTDKGEVIKYTQGRVDNFSLSGLNEHLLEPITLFTSPDCDNLYVLDRKNTRVVVFNKKGEFQGSYVWPGIAGVSDFVVSEKAKKILLLAGTRIYEINLK